MGHELQTPKVRIVTGPPEGGFWRELWAHARCLVLRVYWPWRTRRLLHRGVTRAGRWRNPAWTNVWIIFLWLLTLVLVVWVLSGLAEIGPKWSWWLSPGSRCKANSEACAAVSGVVLPLLVVVASTLLFLVWSFGRIRRFCRHQAMQVPNRLVQTAGSLMDEVVGRDPLCNAIMNNLRNKKARRPHVVVGRVGAGKTALLVRLTQRLAAKGAVPIPVRLRDVQHQEQLDFAELAWRRFREIAQPRARSEAELDRAWRWLRQHTDRVVVLADGLEEALSQHEMSGRRDSVIREAIRRASEHGLPLVIASRPHDPLRAMESAVSELDLLSDEAALHYIARAGSWRADPTLLDRVVEAADMAESPLYLQIARDLHSKDLLEPLWTGSGNGDDLLLYDSWALRADLLETWIDALADGVVHPELPIDHDTRQAVVKHISALACIGLALDRADVELQELDPLMGDEDRASDSVSKSFPASKEWASRVAQKLDFEMDALRWTDWNPPDTQENGKPQPLPRCQEKQAKGAHWWEGPKVDTRLAATWGTRMGLVHEGGDRIHFQHSIVQAFLGSRFLDKIFERGGNRLISQSLDHGGRELLIALVLYSRSVKGRCTCHGGGEPQKCHVNRMRELLQEKAKELLDEAERTERLQEKWRIADRRDRARTRLRHRSPRYGDQNQDLDDRGSLRLRAIEMYGAAVEIDSVASEPTQEDLFEKIRSDWRRLGRNEDASRLREAKLALVSQCGAAARRVAATGSRNPKSVHQYKHEPYRVLFDIGCCESDRQVREAIVKEIGAGGESAYQALCGKLRKPDDVVNTKRACAPNEALPPAQDREQEERYFRAQQREALKELRRKEKQVAEWESLEERWNWYYNTMRAWLLPLLVDSSLMERHLASPRDDLEKWVQVVAQEPKTIDPLTDDPPGAAVSLSVALAQGFKYAANRRLGNKNAREFLVKQAQELLKHSTFWLTRLTLLQALTLWALPDDVNADRPIRGQGADPEGQVREWLTLGDGEPKEHPLVEAAEKLAVHALQTRRPERFLWIDEADVASRVGTEVGVPGEQRAHNLWIPPSTGWSTLDPTAQQLLADVLLLMVLGERAHRPKDLFHVLDLCSRERTQIPSCMSKDHSRLDPVRGAERTSRPGSNCTDECRLRMCPYPAKVENLRLEFSEVFCLHQRDLLKVRQPGRFRPRLRRKAPWQRKVPKAGMRRFWDQMSDRARDINPDEPDTARGRT
jgi:hypothetical protein